MEKNEIIKKIEYIANNASDEQIKLNALSFLLNKYDMKEKEEELKKETEKNNKEFQKKMQTMISAFN